MNDEITVNAIIKFVKRFGFLVGLENFKIDRKFMEHKFPRIRFFSENENEKLVFFFEQNDNELYISVKFFNELVIKRINIEKNSDLNVIFEELYKEFKKVRLENLYGFIN